MDGGREPERGREPEGGADVQKFGEFLCVAFSCRISVELPVHTGSIHGPWSSRLGSSYLIPSLKCVRRSAAVAWPRNSDPRYLTLT